MKHYQTSVPRLCMPACAKMILGDTHDIDEIATLLDYQPGAGVNRWNLSNLQQWGYDVSMGIGSVARLRNCLERGDHPILTVLLRNDEPHAIVLASLGEDEWQIHDPVQPSVISIPSEMLLARWEMMSRFMVVITPGKTPVNQGADGGLPDVGFVYDNNGNALEVYSLAPARQTNYGKIVRVAGILLSGNSIAAGQAESNTLAGLYLAWQNIRFPHISLDTRLCNRVLEPATQDYFSIVLEENDTVRGLAWPGKEFLCTNVDMKFNQEAGIVETTVSGEASTWGPDGVAGPYPPGPPPADPPNDNPSEYWPDWPPPAGSTAPPDPPPWYPEDAVLASCEWTDEQVELGMWDWFIRMIWFKGHLYAASYDEGVWRRDGIGPWTRVFAGPHSGDGGTAWHWEEDDALYVADRNWIYRSVDGVAWVADVNLNVAVGIQGSYDSRADFGSHNDGYLYVASWDVGTQSEYFYRRDLAGNWAQAAPRFGPLEIEGASTSGFIRFDGELYWLNWWYLRRWNGAAWEIQDLYATFGNKDLSVIDDVLYLTCRTSDPLGGGYFYRGIGDAGWSSIGLLGGDTEFEVGTLEKGGDGNVHGVALADDRIRIIHELEGGLVSYPAGSMVSDGSYGIGAYDGDGVFRVAFDRGGDLVFAYCGG